MESYYPIDQNIDNISIPAAYRVVFEAGAAIVELEDLSPEVKALVGEEVTGLFDRLDVIKQEASVFFDVTGGFEVPVISMNTLLKCVRAKINSIYHEQSAGTGEHVNPFLVNDDRLSALECLDTYVRIAKNSQAEETI